MSYGLPRANEYEDEILLLKSRAEKAEAQLKVSEEARQNSVLCMVESNRLALEDQARAEKAEAKINKYHHEMMEAQMFIRDNGHTPSFIEYRKRYNPSASAKASPTDDDLKRD